MIESGNEYQQSIVEQICPKCSVDKPLHYLRQKISCSNPKCNINPGKCENKKKFKYYCTLHTFRCEQCKNKITKRVTCQEVTVDVLNNDYLSKIPEKYKRNKCINCDHLHIKINNLHDYNMLEEMKQKCWKDCCGLSLIEDLLFESD